MDYVEHPGFDFFETKKVWEKEKGLNRAPHSADKSTRRDDLPVEKTQFIILFELPKLKQDF